VAAFVALPSCVPAGGTVQFSNTSTGKITGYLWNFDDQGKTSTAKNPSNTFGSDPTYTVYLTVTGPGGSDGAFLSLHQCP
jgi:PKD repeat protein